MAIELHKNNIIIRNVDFKTIGFKRIRKAYSEWDPVCFKYKNPIYFVLGDDIYFPLGVGENYLVKCFPEKRILDKRHLYPKGIPIKFDMKFPPRDIVQSQAISFMVDGTKGHYNQQASVVLNTGAGKTYVALNAISQLMLTTVVIANDLSLLNQWKERILQLTNLPEESICMITGRPAVTKAVLVAKEAGEPKIYLTSHQTLRSIINENPTELYNIFAALGIGVTIFDECHVEMRSMSWINSLTSSQYTFYLTATNFKSSFMENIVYKNIFSCIPLYIDKSKDILFVDTYLYQMDSLPSNNDTASVMQKRGFSNVLWGSFLTTKKKDQIALLVRRFLTTLKGKDVGKTVIIFPLLDMLKYLQQDLKDDYPECALFVGSVKKKDREGVLRDSQILLTNDKIFNKGLDVSDIECVINFCQLASLVQLEQVFGRLRYNKTKKNNIYIDVTDRGFESARAFLSIRKGFYKKNSKSITDHTDFIIKL